MPAETANPIEERPGATPKPFCITTGYSEKKAALPP